MAPSIRQAMWLILLFGMAFTATWTIQTRGDPTPPFPGSERAARPSAPLVPSPAGGSFAQSAALPATPGTARPSLNDTADDAASREAAAREMRARALDRIEQLLLATRDSAERLDAVQNLSELALSGDPSGRILAILGSLRRDSDPEVAAFAGYKTEEIAAGLAAR